MFQESGSLKIGNFQKKQNFIYRQKIFYNSKNFLSVNKIFISSGSQFSRVSETWENIS